MKTCPKCGVDKPLTKFYKEQRHRDGRRSYCKQCEAIPKRAWRQANPDRYREQRRRWRKANKDHRKEVARRWYKANKDHCKELARRWRKAHPGWNAARLAKTRARIRMSDPSGECSLTAKQWEAIKDAYKHRCVYCGKKLRKFTQDHVVPLSRGGFHCASNVVPACRTCNSSKYTGPPKPFQRAILLD